MQLIDFFVLSKNLKELLWAYRSGLFRKKIFDLREHEAVHQSITTKVNNKEKSSKQPIVISLFRDAAYYLPSFLNHYREKGFKHFYFIDNGSTDNSLDILSQQPDVTVYYSQLPYKDYKWRFKQYLVRRHGKGRWTLFADIDELWDYPLSEKIALNELTQYLDKHNYDAVMGHMINMFSKQSIDTLSEDAPTSLINTFPYFEAETIEKTDYHSEYNEYPSFLKEFRGGIDKRIFGLDTIYLTKIPFLKWNIRIDPHITSHTSNFIRLADFTTTLYHFKFTPEFKTKVERVIKEKSYWNGSFFYKAYHENLQGNNMPVFFSQKSIKADNTQTLIDSQVMQASEHYQQYYVWNNRTN